MEIKYLGENVIQVGPKVRIEPGPPVKVAKATKELLDDEVTAKHYKVSEPVYELDKDGKPTTKQIGWSHVDALGKQIKIGSDMTYVDWKAEKSAYVHNVYVLEPVEETDRDGKKHTREIYAKKDICATEQEALSKATAYAAALEPK